MWTRNKIWPILLIIISVGLCYFQTLSFWFIAPDSLSLIKSSRLESLSDFFGIFSNPLMGGTDATLKHVYYRPITTLIYSIEYVIWGLNPLGYHLTNILAHALVCIFLYLWLFQLSQKKVFALAVALFFSVFPICIVNVSAISRRHDILASLFFIISLWSIKESKWISILFFSLALGSKEISLIFLPLVATYLWMTQKKYLKNLIPYIGITIIYIVWRWICLDGVGGVIGEHYSESRIGIM